MIGRANTAWTVRWEGKRVEGKPSGLGWVGNGLGDRLVPIKEQDT